MNYQCKIRLRGISGDFKGKTWESSSILRVGRLASNEMQIDEISISRSHAEICFHDSRWILKDMGSTNGTFLNYNKLGPERSPIHYDDNIRFGNVAFRVEMLDCGACYFSLARRWDEPGGMDVGVPVHWLIGDIILDRFFVEEVHEGGMGLVYGMRDSELNFRFAVKSPRPEYFQNEEDKQTFLREAEAWKSLGGHFIVNCLLTKLMAGIPRIFVEYVEGGTLAEWMRSGKLCQANSESGATFILSIATQIALGLQTAHLRGVIHQDIKPSNIMVTENGIVKITDFGLAHVKATEVQGNEGGAEAALLATSGGMTPAYCSPEQAEIARLAKAGIPKDRWPKLTGRTDIWSWAVVVIEMMVGKRWQSGNEAGAALPYLTDLGNSFEQLSLKELVWDVRNLLEWCLSVDPEKRPRSMAEVLDALFQMELRVKCETSQGSGDGKDFAGGTPNDTVKE